MELNEYKKRLLSRVCKRLEEQNIEHKVYNEFTGLVYLYQIGELTPAMNYYPFDAIVEIPSIQYKEEGIIIEKVIALFRKHFKE